jgi:hypoxanthine phosphoribosyltransferase
MKYYISQDRVDWMIRTLIRQIVGSGTNYTIVVGIRNGGTHISKPVAEALGLPHQEVHISYYTTKSPIFKNINFTWDKLDNVLIVDDLIDKGKTVKALIHHCNQDLDTIPNSIDVAVLYWKYNSFVPTYYVEEKPDAWVVFPWEEDWREELCAGLD